MSGSLWIEHSRSRTRTMGGLSDEDMVESDLGTGTAEHFFCANTTV